MSDKWVPTTLGEVANVSTGSRQRGGALDGGIPSIGGEHIHEDGTVTIHKGKYISPEHFAAMKTGHLQQGDVLLVKDGATTGKVGYWTSDEQAAVNEHVFILRAESELVDPYFLYALVQSDAFQSALRPHIRGVIGGITRGISALPVPLPPLPIQRRIVDLVAHLDEHIARLQREASANETLLISTRSDAIKGERDSLTLSLGALTEMTRPICYGVLQPGDFCVSGAPLVRIQDMAGDRISGDGLFRISNELSVQYQRSQLVGGEVLVSIRGTIGRVAICPPFLAGGNVSRDVALITPDQRVLPSFLRHVLINTFRTSLIQSGASTRPSLNIGDLRRLEIPAPTMDRQKELADFFDASEVAVRRILDEVETLRRFRASLVAGLLSQQMGISKDYDNLVDEAV